MNNKFWRNSMIFIIITSMLLGACARSASEPTPAVETEPVEPQAEGQPTELAGEWTNVDPSGQTVIFWHPYNWDREKALQEIVGEFNRTNEWGITIQAESQGSYGEIFDKMLGVLNTPDAPGLVVAYQDQAAAYQLTEGLVDMDPLLNSAKWGLSEAEQKDLFEWAIRQDLFPAYGYARLGWPLSRSMEILYYNVDWLKELGYAGPPTTPEQFKEMACKAIGRPFSKATAQGSLGYELSLDASQFASWTFAFGGNVFDHHKIRYTYDSGEAQQAMTFLQDLVQGGCASLAAGDFGDQASFSAGKTLFTTGSSSVLPFYQKAVAEGAQFRWSVAAIPHTTPDPIVNFSGASLSIPKTAPEQELAAWLFLKYYTSSWVQARWANASQSFPVCISAAERLRADLAQDSPYQAALDLLPYGLFEPPAPGYDLVRIKVKESMAAIMNSADVATSLQTLNAEANVILAE